MNKRVHLGFDYWVIIFGLLIYKLPTFLGYSDSILARLLCLSPFFVVIIENIIVLAANNRLEFDRQLFFSFFLYICLLGIAVLRSAFSEEFSTASTFGNFIIWLTFFLFSFLVLSRNNSEEKILKYREAICYGLIVYVIVNSLTYLLGFENPEEIYLSSRPAVMLNLIGISKFRVLFPFSSGINAEGLIAGASLTVSFILLLRGLSNKNRWIGLIGIAFSIFEIFLTDSRGALFFAGITIFISVIFPVRFVKFWRWLPLFTPIIPLLIILTQYLIPVGILEAFSRSSIISGTEILSGRQQIWSVILDHFENFRLIHLFGYGYHGQLISGINQYYSYLFSNFVASDLATAHNYILQTLIEIGYFGLIITFWIISSMMFSLARLIKNNQKDYTEIIIFFLLFYLVLAGTIETVLTPDHQGLFFIFILIWASIGAALPKHKSSF